MAISSVALNMLSVQVNNSLASQSPDESETGDSIDIKQQVKQNLRESIDYQIIIKMMSDKHAEHDNEIQSEVDNSSLKQELNKNNTQSDNSINSDTVSVSEQAMNSFVSSKEQELASLSINRTEEIQQADPLALDLNGDGLQTSGVDNGILFDINGDGSKEQTSFVSGGDAFLAYDRNGNGVIDSGKELFGDNNGFAHGFSELTSYDDNKDGKINAADAIYDKLKLLSVDKDGNQQLSSLHDFGISSISVNYIDHQYAINQYDTITQIGQFEYDNGQTGMTGDILLGYK